MNMLYASSARFDTGRALTEDEMRRIAPSIFAASAHQSRSEKFRPIPTIELLRGLAERGFHAVAAQERVSRDASKRAFCTHLLRIRHIDAEQKHSVGDTVAEILLKNANDGSSVYDLMAGLFRIACLNSMVCQTGTIDSFRIRHTGDAMGKVIEGTYQVLDQAQKALVAPREWSKIKLSEDERQAFAASAHVIRFGEPEEADSAEGEIIPASPVTPDQLLRSRRGEDYGRDLWTTFNVVQENAMRGGLTNRQPGRDPATGKRFRKVTTREIKGIDRNISVNRALWLLGEKMAELKA